jgi:hypothetical protein
MYGDGGGAYGAADCIVGAYWMGAGVGAGVTTYCGAGVMTARGGTGGAFDAIVGGACGTDGERRVPLLPWLSIGRVALRKATG